LKLATVLSILISFDKLTFIILEALDRVGGGGGGGGQVKPYLS
jgi:hypothetical protein